MASDILVCEDCGDMYLAVIVKEEKIKKCDHCGGKFIESKEPVLPRAIEVEPDEVKVG